MSEYTEEKFGKIFYKGQLIDVDSMTIEDRAKIIEELEAKNNELEHKIDKILNVDN